MEKRFRNIQKIFIQSQNNLGKMSCPHKEAQAQLFIYIIFTYSNKIILARLLVVTKVRKNIAKFPSKIGNDISMPEISETSN